MPAEFGLAWSPNRDRSASAVLDGATASGELYIFIDPLFPEGYESFGPVTFYLDGVRFHTERLAPYDFVSGGVDRAGESWDSTTVADGDHVVTVKASPNDGPPVMASATFVVDNEPDAVESVRFATFNASLNRSNEGDLVADLSTPDDEQAKVIAEIIQRTRPEVLVAERVRLRRRAVRRPAVPGELPVGLPKRRRSDRLWIRVQRSVQHRRRVGARPGQQRRCRRTR